MEFRFTHKKASQMCTLSVPLLFSAVEGVGSLNRNFLESSGPAAYDYD